MNIRELIEELENLGGLLGILKKIVNRYNNLGREATKIWRQAFHSRRTIRLNEIPRFYALFKAHYSRARSVRKRELKRYLLEYTEVYNIYRLLREYIRDIRRFVREGERVYASESMEERKFLELLHNWLREVFVYFKERENDLRDIDIFKNVYKFYNKMILTVIDVSTEYTGNLPVPGEFEFVLSCYIHVENFVHESSVYSDTVGTIPIAIAYLLELLDYLVHVEAYQMVYPPHHEGEWKDEYYIYPLTFIDPEIRDLLRWGQFGFDWQDMKILNTVNDKFPAECVIYDHHRGVVRRYLTARLIWDFLKYSIREIANWFSYT